VTPASSDKVQYRLRPILHTTRAGVLPEWAMFHDAEALASQFRRRSLHVSLSCGLILF
jgi:hypothetical protein